MKGEVHKVISAVVGCVVVLNIVAGYGALMTDQPHEALSCGGLALLMLVFA